MASILISGGTGLVGGHLIPLLIENGHKVKVLTRKKTGSLTISGIQVEAAHWNPTDGTIDSNAFEEITHVIHLAGASVNTKWTDRNKTKILESRKDGTSTLINHILDNKLDIEKFISASGINYYGTTEEKSFKESDPAGSGFLSKVCVAWEDASLPLKKAGIARTIFRIGVVLTPKGGPLAAMRLPFRFHLGASLGNGTQFLPWIHVNDLCRGFLYAVEQEDVKGTFNMVAPNAVTNKKFTKVMKKLHGQFLPLPAIPEFFLRMILGKRSALIFDSVRASANEILSTGFAFNFSTIEEALYDLLKSKTNQKQ